MNTTKTFPWVLCLLITSFSSQADTPKRNILFVLADDLGVMDIGVEGSSFYETPHLDGLANSGMRFTQGYSTCQVCSPSRASIMTGTYPARHGITDYIGASTGLNWKRNDRVLPPDYEHHLPHADVSLAEAMKESGYKTFFAGKWHLGDTGSGPEDHGFDINKGGWRSGGPGGGYFSPYKNPALENGAPGESLPMRLAQETVAFIEEHKDKPFFAYLSFYSVHAPMQTTKPLWEKYQKKAESGPKVESRFQFDRTLPVRQVQDHPVYAGMMESMDAAIGLVLNRLDDLGLAEDTVVIFTSDNGGVSSGDAYATACLPYRGGKGRQWEGGIRQPYYIRVPGVTRPGAMDATPVTGTDFYPTILELAGQPLKPKQHVDGVSLVPLLRGGTIAERDLFWHYPHYGNQGGEPSAIIRSGDWKLIHYYEDGRDELYHLPEDLGEQKDLAAAEKERVVALRTILDAWLKETGARIPEQDARFDAVKKKKHVQGRQTEFMKGKERNHARFLNPSFRPHPTWWNSLIADD